MYYKIENCGISTSLQMTDNWTFLLGIVLNKETYALAINYKITAKFENIEIHKWKETKQDSQPTSTCREWKIE